jgi:trimeric autotransporter adhesin
MKKILALCFCLANMMTLIAQDKMYIFKTDQTTLGAPITQIDSMVFTNNGSTAQFTIDGTASECLLSTIDSINFGDNSTVIDISYNGSSASIVNPLAFEGVSITTSGADVTVTSTIDSKNVTYNLSGTTTDGTFKVYSNRAFNLQLSGVSITNTDGPAINIQSQKSVAVTLTDGTTNTLTDGTTYATAPDDSDGEAEDQKGVFFSEAKLAFSGTGSLILNGKGTGKHALCTDETLEIDNGTITVNSALKDGLHGGSGVILAGGTIYVASTSSCIDGEYINISDGTFTGTCTTDTVNAISCDSTFTMTGGNLTLTISGAQSKGIKSDQAMTLSGGTVQITASGKAVLEATSVANRYNPAYCTALKSDSSITNSGANITIIHTGTGGKGISAGTDFTMTGGTVNITTSGGGAVYVNSDGETDYYHSTCITTDKTLNILGGTLTTKSSGIAGKGLITGGALTFGTSDSAPTISITTTGAASSYAEAKAVKADGAVAINNGNITISSANDAIKSETSITMALATLTITTCYEGLEAPTITFDSGTASITATNDCINGTYGTTSGGTESNDGAAVVINGGTIMTNITNGDGIDSNGNLVIKGGTIIVQGPSSSPEVGIDYNGTLTITGGLLMVCGPNSGSMIQPSSSSNYSSSSTQYCLVTKISATVLSSSLFNIQDASGKSIVTFKPAKTAYYFAVSSPSFTSGTTYKIYVGGSTTGTSSNGLYTGGVYTIGTLKGSKALSSTKIVTLSY